MGSRELRTRAYRLYVLFHWLFIIELVVLGVLTLGGVLGMIMTPRKKKKAE